MRYAFPPYGIGREVGKQEPGDEMKKITLFWKRGQRGFL
jgi:hypothetical protein